MLASILLVVFLDIAICCATHTEWERASVLLSVFVSWFIESCGNALLGSLLFNFSVFESTVLAWEYEGMILHAKLSILQMI